MGIGEYVSVNSQRDSQQALITEERRELKQHPEDELDELVRLYVAKGSPRRPPSRWPSSSRLRTPSRRTWMRS